MNMRNVYSKENLLPCYLTLMPLMFSLTEHRSVLSLFSLPVRLQPRLLQKPHRFLRDPLLRSDAARDGGLDHAVHNRIRPDVWLRLPAGVEKEGEGVGEGGRRQEGESNAARWKEVWKDNPPHPPHRRSYRSDAVLGSARFFWTISPSPIKKTLEKKKISQD